MLLLFFGGHGTNHITNIFAFSFQSPCVKALTLPFTDGENEEQRNEVISRVPQLGRAGITSKAWPLLLTLGRGTQ